MAMSVRGRGVFLGEEHREYGLAREAVSAINGSFRVEIRDSYIHDGVWPYPGGGGYGVSLSWGSSEVLIENNIVPGMNKVMVVEVGRRGLSRRLQLHGQRLYRESARVGRSRHQRKPHGRRASRPVRGQPVEQLRLGRHARERLRDDDLPQPSGRRAAKLSRSSQCARRGPDVRVVVALVHRATSSARRADDGVGLRRPDWATPSIWKFGYAPSHCEQAAGSRKCSSTVAARRELRLRDEFGAVGPTPQMIPDSLYLSAKPAFFGARPWPWCGFNRHYETWLTARTGAVRNVVC